MARPNLSQRNRNTMMMLVGVVAGMIGLAYASQELNTLPMGPHDQRLDGVVTERGYRALGGA